MYFAASTLQVGESGQGRAGRVRNTEKQTLVVSAQKEVVFA